MKLIGYGLALAGALSGTSCKTTECGENTVERDHQCVAEVMPPGTQCGTGTAYDPVSGLCLNNLYADGGGICGANTVEVVGDGGNHYCVGTGSSSCDEPLPCPLPSEPNATEKVTLCGRLYNLEDSTPLSESEDTTQIILKVFDPFAFALFPNTTKPIVTRRPDFCGRFAIRDIPRPQIEFIAIAADDLESGGIDAGTSIDLFVQTGIATVNPAGGAVSGLRLFVMKQSTANLWTSALSLSTNIAVSGAYVPIYIKSAAAGGTPVPPLLGAPQSAVAVTKVETGGETELTTNIYYFSDTNAAERKVPVQRNDGVPATTKTGANGAALVLSQPEIATFGGEGNEVMNGQTVCPWNNNQAATPEKTIFVQEKMPGPDQGCP